MKLTIEPAELPIAELSIAQAKMKKVIAQHRGRGAVVMGQLAQTKAAVDRVIEQMALTAQTLQNDSSKQFERSARETAHAH